jgi:hypothetical protein
LAPGWYEGGGGQIERGDDPIELRKLMYKRISMYRGVGQTPEHRRIIIGYLLKSEAMNDSALATIVASSVCTENGVGDTGIST